MDDDFAESASPASKPARAGFGALTYILKLFKNKHNKRKLTVVDAIGTSAFS
jgi:hypothetical protein